MAGTGHSARRRGKQRRSLKGKRVAARLHKLADWLEFQQQQHPQAIALGLDRVREVAARLELGKPAPLVLTVAGTNGKGSCVAILRSVLSAAGLRTGAYTSPHLLDYRERIQLPEGLVSEAQLVDAFEHIEHARGVLPLTFFEYGTLAALWVFAQKQLDAVILEVGLGGRLDAVNIVDADAVLLTTVDLDHQQYLGATRELIGFEKAGVLRAGQVALYADQPPVASVLRHAADIHCELLRPGPDYQYWREAGSWRLRIGDQCWSWPWPSGLVAPVQIHNLAACVSLLHGLRDRWPWSAAAVASGLQRAQIPARLQLLAEQPQLWLDIAHNPQAAASLRQWLLIESRHPTVAVFAALADKDVGGVIAAVQEGIDHWILLGLDAQTPRGLSAEALAALVPSTLHAETAVTIDLALKRARELAGGQGRVLVFGSFYLAALLLAELAIEPFMSIARESK